VSNAIGMHDIIDDWKVRLQSPGEKCESLLCQSRTTVAHVK
jgi:hypothetical protein